MNKFLRRFSVALLFAALAYPSFADEVTAADLLKACSRKTEVWERVNEKLESVGQKLDAFCEGYLSGSFFTLLSEDRICLGTHSARPEYLESVFRIHSSRDLVDLSQYAVVALKEAFTRAFPCKR